MSSEKTPFRPASGVGALAFVCAGFLIWAAQFAVTYAATTFACAVMLEPRWADFWIVAATIAALIAIAAHVLRPAATATLFGVPAATAHGEGLVRAGRLVALLSAIAVVWTGASVVFVDACVQGR